ncbi:MAG: hypothetical protein QW572_04375 [Candidatus Nitrosocaldus sp.]
MKGILLVSSVVIVILLLSIALMPYVHAGQIRTATVGTKSNMVEAEFLAQRTVTIEYSAGGALRDKLAGVVDDLVLKADESNPSIDALKAKIDQALRDAQSPTRVKEVKNITYNLSLRGEDKKAVISQNLLLKIVLSDVVIEQGLYGQPSIIDLNWKGLRVDGNVPMEFSVDGKTVTMDINTTSGYLQTIFPDVFNELSKDANYKYVLDEPLLDFSRLNEHPIDKWHRLINPIAGQVQGQEAGFKEKEGAKAVTVISGGETSIREGELKEKVLSTELSIDGNRYRIESVEPKINASIDVLWWAEPFMDGNASKAKVFLEDPNLTTTSSGNFPLMVLLTFAGMMGAIAGFVIWRANKK